MTNLKNLVLVPGHATFRADLRGVPPDPEDDHWWALANFQHGEPPAYIEHIRQGVAELETDPYAMLVFSGGRTRQEGGLWSEAATYNAIASHYKYWQANRNWQANIAGRVALEPYARDSLDNLDYALQTFLGRTARRARKVTIVGWNFKKERFLFHAQTLNLSPSRVRYVGVNDPEPSALIVAEQSERETLELFKADPRAYNEPLISKRVDRNPFDVPRPQKFYRP